MKNNNGMTNSMKKASVSVLMTVFNTPFELTKRAIDSVLGQDYADFDLIVLDDGSDKRMGKFLLDYCSLHESKITYIRHHNRGQSLSINRGVKISTGEHIAIIDSDDEYKSNHLSACLREMAHSDLICSLTDTIVNSEADYYLPDKDDYTKSIHVDDCYLFATFFGKRQVFEQLKFKDNYAADADFYAEACECFRVKKVNLRTYVYYRNMPNSITARLKTEQLALLTPPQYAV